MKANRLFFIDAIRAWAILMMLQGHFIDGLLDPIFRNPENTLYSIWLYFRGITAPVFFTVSGFIFTYLLIRVPEKGLENPRVKKGVRRGLQLLLIGYLLRLNLFGLFKGELYEGFYLVDVLHCIGVSILVIIGVYLFTIQKKRIVFPVILLGLTLLMFLLEPVYKQFTFSFLPTGLANYFTKVNGSVFTIIPWLGYTAFGAFLSLLFTHFKNVRNLYAFAIPIAALSGFLLIYFSSPFFLYLHQITGIELFTLIYFNNYLFIRLGDVLVVFAIFMLLRQFLTNSTLLKIGSSTLSIYVIHFIILYGSFTGLGLYKFFHHELHPSMAIMGAILFMFACTFLALLYDRREAELKSELSAFIRYLRINFYVYSKKMNPFIKEVLPKIKLFVLRLFAAAKN